MRALPSHCPDPALLSAWERFRSCILLSSLPCLLPVNHRLKRRRLAAGFEDTNFSSPSTLKAHTISLTGSGLKDRHIGNLNGASFSRYRQHTRLRVGLGVLLNHVDAGHNQLRYPATLRTLPRLPLSLPARIITSSSRLIFNISLSSASALNNFRGQRNNLHKLLATQFASYRSKNTSTDRCVLAIQQAPRRCRQT